MSIGKPRGKAGKIPVYIYSHALRKKVYVGQADNERAARRLEAVKDDEINGPAAATRPEAWTVERFAQHFLDAYHGPGTTRPETTTLAHNRSQLRVFRERFGSRRLDSFGRDEAHEFARQHPHQAKTVAAMFAEAVDKHGLPGNPFRGMGHKSRGRSDITPLTEDEVERVATLAELSHGVWGREFAALVRVLAWTGVRPGEACGLEWPEVDFRRGLLRVEWQRRNDGTRTHTKTKLHRTVVMGAQARQALMTLQRSSGPVFRSPTGRPLRPNSLRHYWLPVRAGFEGGLTVDHWLARRLRHDPDDHLDPYELRHFFGSVLADRGLSARDIAAQMGNSPRVCEDVYLHDHRDRVQERVRRALEGPQVTGLRSVAEPKEAANG